MRASERGAVGKHRELLRAEGEEDDDDDDEGKKKEKMANMVVSDKTRSIHRRGEGRSQQFLVTSQVMTDIGRVPIKVGKAVSEGNR